jgi:peptide/nickel transport system permease protein
LDARAPRWPLRGSWEFTLAVATLLVFVFAAVGASPLSRLFSNSPELGQWLVATRQIVIAVAAVVSLALPAGCVLGGFAALGPRVVRGLLTRSVELSGALPSLILLGLWRLGTDSPTLASFVTILILLKSVLTARLVAEQTGAVTRQGYVLAARALGSTKRHIFRVFVLPQLLPSLAVNAGTTAAYVVGLEGALSFVGLGPENVVSWGTLLGRAASGGPESSALVGACLASLVLSTLALYAVVRPR